MIIGYCLCCGSDELLVLNGFVTCLACKEKYTVEFFQKGLPEKPEDMLPASGDASMEARYDPGWSDRPL